MSPLNIRPPPVHWPRWADTFEFAVERPGLVPASVPWELLNNPLYRFANCRCLHQRLA